MENFTCPRRSEGGLDRENSRLKYSGRNLDSWREGDTCDFCGSLNPDVFMRKIQENTIKIVPTDKNYKVYVDGIPDPKAGEPKVYGWSNTINSPGKDWVQITVENRSSLPIKDSDENGSWVLVRPTETFIHHKFYFQHLSKEQRFEFIDLLNAQKLNIDVPGYFCVLPFFCQKIE